MHRGSTAATFTPFFLSTIPLPSTAPLGTPTLTLPTSKRLALYQLTPGYCLVYLSKPTAAPGLCPNYPTQLASSFAPDPGKTHPAYPGLGDARATP